MSALRLYGWVSAPMVLKPMDGLIINASQSVDPDDPTPLAPTYPFGPFMYRWQCVNVTTDGVTPERFPLDSCFNDVMGVLNPDSLTPSLRVPQGLLQEGKFLFVLTVSKEPLFNALGQVPGRMESIKRLVTVKSPAKPRLTGNMTLAANFSQFQANPVAFQTALVGLVQVEPGLTAQSLVSALETKM